MLSLFFSSILCGQQRIAENKINIAAAKSKYLIEQFTIEDGLSDGVITAILQDRNGYLWIGTNDGLNRYDGYEFKIFKHQPGISQSISNNLINALCEDRKGRLWVATNGGLNCFDPVTESFQRFQHDPQINESINHNFVNAIFEDKQGTLWLGTKLGLNKFDEQLGTFRAHQHHLNYQLHYENSPTQTVYALGETEDQELIVGFATVGLMYFDRTSENFQEIFTAKKGDQNPFGVVIDWIGEPQHGKIRFTSNGQLWQLENDQVVLHPENGPLHQQLKGIGFAKSIGAGLNIVGKSGVLILDDNFKNGHFFIPNSDVSINPVNNWVLHGIEDRAGDLWLGSFTQGLFHLNSKGKHFTNFQSQANLENSILHNRVNALLEIDEDIVWVGTRRNGINIFNRKDNSFQPLPQHIDFPAGMNHKEIGALYKDEAGNIWIGTWGRGLNLFRPNSRTFEYFDADENDPASLPDPFITDILETEEKEIWVGTPLGLAVLCNADSIANRKFKIYNHLSKGNSKLNNRRVNCLSQCSNGDIWVGTADGLHLFQREKDGFIIFNQDVNDISTLSNNIINVVFEDSKKRLWIGTASGLNRYVPETASFVQYLEKEGLADGFINGIQEDPNGYLWLATKTGISKFDPENEVFKNYNAKDGLFNSNFTNRAFIRSEETGYFYTGGKNGLSIFHPDNIEDNTFVPPVFISSLKKISTTNDEMTEVEVLGIAHTPAIELAHHENILTFEFTTLNFRNSKKNEYAYQLEGFNQGWINIGQKREITLTNLDPGEYTLSVKGSNNDGLWNEKGSSLKIKIHPPWWKTNWAYLGYAILGLSLLLLIYRVLLRRQELKLQLEQEQDERHRLKELDSFKSKLYTNLTHEFRTPLTIILGMIELISKEPKKFLEQGTELIERNGRNLLRLINQLLDLSKLENKSFQLQLQQGDIIPYLGYVTESFQSFAKGRNLSLNFHCQVESLQMDHDPEQIKQVMTNLISNAIKFTPAGGEVNVRVLEEKNELKIEVQDTGIGIPQKDLANIFDRFYQVDGSTTREGEGTGIGLAHTQELIRLMGGRISVESELNQGSNFLLSLPIRNTAEVVTEIENGGNGLGKDQLFKEQKSPATLSDEINPKSDLPHLLIVEDNPDVVIYLKSCLEGQYQLDVAYNGKTGIEKALENIPDLIISDVMMPEKDGFELCDTLKNDERTSHVPIILLTAKADAKSRLTGLSRGADAYLSKPFDKEELLVRIAKMVERQKKLVAYFSKINFASSLADPAQESLEEHIEIESAFMQKVKAIVEDRYADENFALPDLCKEIGMSRSQLFRKMKALINTSPSEFIRSYRLNKASGLLSSTELTVSEIAWKTGYKDLSHFSKSFQKEFGFSPSVNRK